MTILADLQAALEALSRNRRSDAETYIRRAMERAEDAGKTKCETSRG